MALTLHAQAARQKSDLIIAGGTVVTMDANRAIIGDETRAAGMRAVLGETLIDFPAPDNKTESAMLAYTEAFLKKWSGDPLIHAAVAPHSMYTCSKKTLQDAAALARRYHAPILIHVAEMKKEYDDSRAQHGVTPVQYLEQVGL